MLDFLKKLNLKGYLVQLEEEGIDDLETLRCYSEQELKELGLKGGHAKKITKALSENTLEIPLNYPNTLEPRSMFTYLAHPWDEYVKESHSSVKLHWLVDTTEVVVKWICALLLAEIRYANENTLPVEIQEKFKENIARPTLGVWLNLVKELSKEAKQKSVFKNIFDFYSNELNVNGLFPDEGDDKSSLLKLRNRIAHGGGTTESQSKAYLNIYSPRLESLLKSINTMMSDAKLYGEYKGKSYLLEGLFPKEETSNHSLYGPSISFNGVELALWPLVDFDVIRQVSEHGAIKESSALAPQTYSRIDKQGVHYIPIGVDESYSITDRQEEFETIFGLKKKTENNSKIKRHKYQHNDFLLEARYLKEELIGRTDELKCIKSWIKDVDGFDDKLDCRFIYGGPGLGKSMLMASVASDLSNDKNHHTFYYRFRGGDARNTKYWFVKLLRDSLISWNTLIEISQEAKDDLIDIEEMLQDINHRLDKIKEIPSIPATKYQAEIRPIVRFFIDGLDEILASDSTMLTLIESLKKEGVVIFVATRLENGAQKLEDAYWIKALEFKEGVCGLPKMSNSDIRAMLLESIPKQQRKELIKSDSEDEDIMNNHIVQSISQKADGLPLYIHLLINDIQKSKYSITQSSEIPDGLNHYYHELVSRMGINDIDSYKAPIVTLLSLTSEPIDIEAIALALEDIDDAKETQGFIKEVVLAVGSLLKQVNTPEGTTGYTLYHQSFKDFILKAQDDKTHPLYRTVIKIKKYLNTKTAQWRELPSSNFKNHLFRYGNHYSLWWQKDSLYIVKNRLIDLEYLLERTKSLRSREINRLVKEYELVHAKLSKDQQKEFYVWSSFFTEQEHLISRVDREGWKPSQSLFQLAYEDGDNSELSMQADVLLQKEKIDFLWIKNKNREKKFTRSGLLKVFQGHSDSINGVHILSDSRIVSYSRDKTLRLWSKEGETLSILKGHNKAIDGVNVLKDGRIISYSRDNYARLWSSEGEFLEQMRGHSSLAMSAIKLNERNILSYPKNKIIRLWKTPNVFDDLEEGVLGARKAIELDKGLILSYKSDRVLNLYNRESTVKTLLEGHTDFIVGAIELHNGNILSFSRDKTLRLYDSTGILKTSMLGHTDIVEGAIELSNGNIISYSNDETLRMWNSQGVLQVVLEGHINYVNGVIELRNGNILSYSSDETLILWNSQGELKRVLKGHTHWINGVIELDNGDILSYSWDETLRLWSSEGEFITALEGHTDVINGVKELCDGNLLSFAQDNTLRLWSAKGILQTTGEESIKSVKSAMELSNTNVLSCSMDKKLSIWNSSGILQATLRGHSGSVIDAIELENDKLLSYSWDKTLRLWDAKGELINIMSGHSSLINGALGLSNGNIVSYEDDEPTLRLWSSEGVPRLTLKGHTSVINGVLEVSENRFLSYSLDKTLILWNEDGSVHRTLEAHTSNVVGAIKLRNGNMVSYSRDKTLILWDKEGSIQNLMQGHKDLVNGAIELKNGNILSYSWDNTLKLWDNEGELQATLDGHENHINGIIELSNGDILSYSNDETLILWDREGRLKSVFEDNIKLLSGVIELSSGNLLSYSGDSILRLWSDEGLLLESVYIFSKFIKPKKTQNFLGDFTVLGNNNNLYFYELKNANESISFNQLSKKKEEND